MPAFYSATLQNINALNGKINQISGRIYSVERDLRIDTNDLKDLINATQTDINKVEKRINTTNNELRNEIKGIKENITCLQHQNSITVLRNFTNELNCTQTLGKFCESNDHAREQTNSLIESNVMQLEEVKTSLLKSNAEMLKMKKNHKRKIENLEAKIANLEMKLEKVLKVLNVTD